MTNILSSCLNLIYVGVLKLKLRVNYMEILTRCDKLYLFAFPFNRYYLLCTNIIPVLCSMVPYTPLQRYSDKKYLECSPVFCQALSDTLALLYYSPHLEPLPSQLADLAKDGEIRRG